MSKGLKTLKKIFGAIEMVDKHKNCHFDMEEIADMFVDVEKELKALEVIKNALGIHLVETIENKHYIEITGEDIVGLCKENYDLLKEVLL